MPIYTLPAVEDPDLVACPIVGMAIDTREHASDWHAHQRTQLLDQAEGGVTLYLADRVGQHRHLPCGRGSKIAHPDLGGVRRIADRFGGHLDQPRHEGFAILPLAIVTGVITQDMGVAADGTHKGDYQPGMEIHAKYTLFAEGARGNLTKQLKKRFDLEADCQPQVYGLGIKEIWDIAPDKHVPGRVIHTQGWPLSESESWGGGFLYHQANGQVAIGFVTALDYRNPWVSPFQEFQRWKQHPAIREYLEGGKRVAYGARAISEGGWQSMPKMVAPGVALLGCSVGMVNVPRIKGNHNAMLSGKAAAEAAHAAITAGRAGDELAAYEAEVRGGAIGKDLKKVRNVKPMWSKFGLVASLMAGGADMWANTFGLTVLGTLKHGKTDAAATGKAKDFKKIDYPKPDGKLSFDRLTNVAFSFTNHDESQPAHLKLKDASVPIAVNLPLYDEPAQRYCPAGVYEVIGEGADARFQINFQNCVHCKTCDIKDPNQNINWTTPQGGDGPNYPNM